MFGKRRLVTIGLLAISLVLSLAAPAAASGSHGTGGSHEPPGFAAALAAKERNEARLLAHPNIDGAGVTTSNGQAAVVVWSTAAGAAPATLNGVPVVEVVGSMIVARATDPQSRLRPPTLCASIGHPSITAGTYGALVEDGQGNQFMMSNNHVLADVNSASIGDSALQPGPADGGADPADRVASLFDFQPIDFNWPAPNAIDAAIASPEVPVSASTPADLGYGTPTSTPVAASNGQSVQKCGRTTGHTTGSVTATNVTVDICYQSQGPFRCKKNKLARFDDQIAIGSGAFSAGGDYGSLIVDTFNNPVGLLFAGNSTTTFANKIQNVLAHFNVTIATSAGDTPPSVTVTSPLDGATVSGTVVVTADASDDNGVTEVEFFVDGGSIGVDTNGVDGWSASWVTTTASEGGHAVSAEATDTVGKTGSDSISVTVDNVDDPPTVSITNPSDDSTVGGTVVVTADASDDNGVTQVEFFVDGGSIGTDTNGGDGWSASWDTTGETDDAHTVSATATDTNSQTANDSVNVTVDNTVSPSNHVGDLDGSSTKLSQGNWSSQVVITVDNGSHAGVAGIIVTGDFMQNGTVETTDSCTTDGTGACTVDSGQWASKGGSGKSFVVTGVSGDYDALANHDPDGDSDGTTIALSK